MNIENVSRDDWIFAGVGLLLVIDLLFLGSMALWGASQFSFTHLSQIYTYTVADAERSIIFFIGFMLIDFLTCVVAFTLERHEDWALLWPLLLQRFYYRQMMYFVLFRSLMGAVQGKPVGWRGVEPETPAPTPTLLQVSVSRDAK